MDLILVTLEDRAVFFICMGAFIPSFLPLAGDALVWTRECGVTKWFSAYPVEPFAECSTPATDKASESREDD